MPCSTWSPRRTNPPPRPTRRASCFAAGMLVLRPSRQGGGKGRPSLQGCLVRSCVRAGPGGGKGRPGHQGSIIRRGIPRTRQAGRGRRRLAWFCPGRARLYLCQSGPLVQGDRAAGTGQARAVGQRHAVEYRRARGLQRGIRCRPLLRLVRTQRSGLRVPAAGKLSRYPGGRLGFPPWPPAHRLGRDGRLVLRRRGFRQGHARIRAAGLPTHAHPAMGDARRVLQGRLPRRTDLDSLSRLQRGRQARFGQHERAIRVRFLCLSADASGHQPRGIA
jgi:hypothetical protein